MALTYFKRYRMEIDLVGRDLSSPRPPSGYYFLPWERPLMEAHAQAKYLSFREEIDANVFPCLGELAGCRRLMSEIATKEGFLPEATWLAAYHCGGTGRYEYCGTIQGISNRFGTGSVQNVGIAPAHRNRGLGTCLINRALQGFLRAGLSHIHLEVTADNEGAIRLYRRLGFVTLKTVFKAVEVVYA
jgi:ribosomal protein S18 acetylase RimI-like enzyme